MADKKPTIKLWSTQLGKIVDFEVRIENQEIVAEQGDTGEVLKFPGGITKDELLELAEAHNEANDGIKARTDEDLQAEQELEDTNNKLLEDLQ